MFGLGLDQMLFHRCAQQPHPTAVPGMAMGPWGFHFDRTNTWFEQSRPWLEYLARAQWMLRQGTNVSDVLYFIGERPPDVAQMAMPVLPAGYNFDLVNADVLLTRASMKEGRIALAGGRVIAGGAIGDVLRERRVRPDFEYVGKQPDTALSWLHRSTLDAEIYFVGNRQRRVEKLVASFRLADGAPEIWHPETGRSEGAAIFAADGERTNVPLQLEAGESVFVVFKRGAKAAPAGALRRDGQDVIAAAKPTATTPTKITHTFTMMVWARPDIDLRAMPREATTGWLDETGKFYVVPAAEGDVLFGPGHAMAGLAVGRNGAYIVERSSAHAPAVLVANLPIAGWTHFAVVHRDGRPRLYVNGKLVREGLVSGNVVHPGIGSPPPSPGTAYHFTGLDALLRSSGLPPPEDAADVELTRRPDGQVDALVWRSGSYALDRPAVLPEKPIKRFSARRSVFAAAGLLAWRLLTALFQTCMSTTHPAPVSTAPKAWWQLSQTQQILVGLVLGCAIGWWMNQMAPADRKIWDDWFGMLRDLFLHLVKAMLAPLVFASVVTGIAGTGDMKKVGRMGAKAILYFEIVTTAALAVGLLVVNLTKPGVGVVLAADAAKLGSAAMTKPQTFFEIVLHAFPTSFVDAMARNDVLQVVVFASLFAMAVIAAGEIGKPVLTFCDSLTQVMFKFAGIIMTFAPVGVGAAIAVTIGDGGFAVLGNLVQLVLSLYLALAIFIVVVFGTVIAVLRIPLTAFVRAVREPFTIAFATANSEAALPKAFVLMEKFGVPRGIVSFVLPAGYAFNLDGSTLYLAMASVFVAQAAESATGVHFGIGQQITMMLVLMLTSKGVAAVPRASIVVLIAALTQFGLPEKGAALILGVDALMDMARTSVNVVGNCLASVVVARWEGEFDEAKARANFGTPAAARLAED